MAAKTPSRIATLDLGMQTVTMAVFDSAAGGGLTLTGFTRADLVPDPAADASRFGQLRVVLGEMKNRLGWKGGAVACAIPSQGVFARFVQIPKCEPDQIGPMLFFEAQQNVPYPIEEVAWAHQLLGEKDDKLNALIIATKRDNLESTVEAMGAAGFIPQVIETSPTALYNAFRYNYPDARGCSLLIDIGARATNLIFMEGEEVFIRTLPIGGNTITAALHKKFDTRTFNEVEEFKRTEGLIPPPGNYAGAKTEDIAEMGKIARTVMTRIHNEITRSITFYRTSQGGSAPMRAYLAGGGVSMPYTLEFFNEKLSLPIEFFNALRRVNAGGGVDAEAAAKSAHLLGECAGLALRAAVPECPVQISLKSPSIEREAVEIRRRPFLIAAAACLLVSLSVVGLYFRKTASEVAAINSQFQSQIAPLDKTAKRIAELIQQRDRMLADGADLAAAPLLRTGWAELINELNQRQPAKFLWVTRLSPYPPAPGFGGAAAETRPAGRPAAGAPTEESAPMVTALSIEGLYLDNVAGAGVVDEFVNNLAQSPLFDITDANKADVVQVRATQSGDQWAYDYRLVVPLKRPIPL